MISCKAAGPSGVISEMLKAAGEEGLEKLRLFAELVFSGIGRRASNLTSTNIKEWKVLEL